MVGVLLTVCNFIPYIDFIPKIIANSISWGWKVIIVNLSAGESYRPFNFYRSDWEFVTLLPLSILIGVLLCSTQKWQKNIGRILVCIFSFLVVTRFGLALLG